MEQVRIDKYLWAIRLFKTRSLATKACNAGKVKHNGVSIKPSFQVREGMVISARVHHVLRTIEVVKLIDKRVGASIAETCYKDLTPKEEFERVRSERSRLLSHEKRDRGIGRPTKKERRDIEDFKSGGFDDWEDW